jgi:hypothetical protein
VANDTTIKSLFDHAKQPAQDPSIQLPPTVYATYVEHAPNSHPSTSPDGADLVMYANGPLTLSAGKTHLRGEMILWRNNDDQGSPAIFDLPELPPDVFAGPQGKVTIAFDVSSAGTVTYEKKLNGTSIGGLPPWSLNATFVDAMFVEKTASGVKSLSFTLHA